MPSSITKIQVQSFTGMITYLAKFSPRLCQIAEPIRELAKDKVPFNWGPKHQEAFSSLKKEIVNASMLAYYSPKKQTTLQTDASIKGFVTYLLQDSKPVYFARKALIDAQKGYVANQLEAFVVTWALEKFHHFLMPATFFL